MYKIHHQICAFVMPLIVRHDDSLQANSIPSLITIIKYKYLFTVRLDETCFKLNCCILIKFIL